MCNGCLVSIPLLLYTIYFKVVYFYLCSFAFKLAEECLKAGPFHDDQEVRGLSLLGFCCTVLEKTFRRLWVSFQMCKYYHKVGDFPLDSISEKLVLELRCMTSPLLPPPSDFYVHVCILCIQHTYIMRVCIKIYICILIYTVYISIYLYIIS